MDMQCLMRLLYEGHSINKSQNDIILPIFNVCKIQNTDFVWNLVTVICWKFVYS